MHIFSNFYIISLADKNPLSSSKAHFILISWKKTLQIKPHEVYQL